MTEMKRKLLVMAAVFCLVFFGGTKFIARGEGQLLPILMYHDLCPDTETPGRYAVTASRFREDMQWLRENGYTAMVAADLVAAQRSGKYPEKPVLITFDDGYRSNYTIAYPILSEQGLKATVCVVGTFLDDPKDVYMTWEQAAVLQESGVIDIQSHTYALHSFANGDEIWPPYGMGVYRLAEETDDAYRSRFSADTALMREKLAAIGSDFLLQAYPYGLCDPWSIELLKETGVKVTLLTSDRIHRTDGDLYAMTRMEVTTERSVADILG